MDTRPIKHEDMFRILELGKMMHQESAYRDLDYDYASLMKIGEEVVKNPAIWFGRLIEDNQKQIIGFMIGYIVPYFFSQEKIAQDLVLYVEKNKRGGLSASKLIREFEFWSAKNNAQVIYLGITTKIDEDRARALYEFLGYEHAGVLMKKGVSQCALALGEEK